MLNRQLKHLVIAYLEGCFATRKDHKKRDKYKIHLNTVRLIIQHIKILICILI